MRKVYTLSGILHVFAKGVTCFYGCTAAHIRPRMDARAGVFFVHAVLLTLENSFASVINHYTTTISWTFRVTGSMQRKKSPRAARAFRKPFWWRLFFFKGILACSAHRAAPIGGQGFKRGSGGNSIVRITGSRIINILTNSANPRFHG